MKREDKGRETRPPNWNFWLRHWHKVTIVVGNASKKVEIKTLQNSIESGTNPDL